MPDEIAVIPVSTETSDEKIEAIAEAVAEKINDEEDETKWVRDLFEEEFRKQREATEELCRQVRETLERVPTQESYNRMLEMLTSLAATTILANTPTPETSTEPKIVIQEEPEPMQTEVLVNAEDAEKDGRKQLPKRRRL